MKPKNKKK
jgi:hypothetical protein